VNQDNRGHTERPQPKAPAEGIRREVPLGGRYPPRSPPGGKVPDEGTGGRGAGAQGVVETEDLWRVYRTGTQEVAALQGISIKIEPGQFVVVKGRSGSGKTTLLNCLGGLDRPTSGLVRVFGEELSTMGERQLTEWRQHRIGFVFQSFGLLPTFSAYENVELAARIAHAPSRARRERTCHCLDLVGLTKWMGHRPYELSGGQQQRVAIARALVNRPQLILADEPTGELDSVTAREIFALFRRIVEVEEEQVTILMASHDVLAAEYADELLQLEDGQIV